MNNDIFSGCSWLTFPDTDANLTRSRFQLGQYKKVSVCITALGYFEAYLNGSPLSDEKFIPAMSEYEKRDLTTINMPTRDEFDFRIYFYEYDVTPLVKTGENLLAVHIGAGWYGQHRSLNEGMSKWGDNLLVFTITAEKEDGTKDIIRSSPDNTKWKKSFILESSLYFGEYQDARAYEDGWKDVSFDDSSWAECAVRKAPESRLCKCDFPSDRVIRSLTPVKLRSFGDTAIYDIGETAAGYLVITFDEEARTNDTVTVRYADALKEDDSLEFHYCGGTSRMQRDFFICAPDKGLKEFYPHFTWHAGRYIEVTGRANAVRFDVIHSDIKQVSTFTSDNEMLNWLFDAYIRTQTDNVHGCIPSDCPHRERLGYTGDGQLTCGAVMSVFDAREMYRKWCRDIRDTQDKKGGHVQHTAPFYGGGGGPGGWGGAACIVPYRYYEFYNDITMLEDSFDSMKAYIGYLLRHCENGLVTSAEPGGWCLGDWCPPHNDVKIPESFVNTYFLAKCAKITAKTASILGAAEEAEYKEIAVNAEKALYDHFFDESTGSFCEGTQGADAFAIDLGIGNEKTLAALTEKYSTIADFDTGIFGTYLLIKVLFEKGYGNIAFRLLTSKGENTFFNMKAHGATTLWENWDGCDSRCHPMFGALIECFFSGFLGIRSFKPGFSEISISPADIPELKKIHGSFGTVNGTVTVDITTSSDGTRNLSVSVPDTIRMI